MPQLSWAAEVSEHTALEVLFLFFFLKAGFHSVAQAGSVVE